MVMCALELSFIIRHPEMRKGFFRSLYVVGNRFLSLSAQRPKTTCRIEYLIMYSALLVSILFTVVLFRLFVIVRDYGYDFVLAFFTAVLSVHSDYVDDDLFFNDSDGDDNDEVGSDNETTNTASGTTAAASANTNTTV